MVLHSGTGRKGRSPHSGSHGRQTRAGELCPVKVLNMASHSLFASQCPGQRARFSGFSSVMQ